MNFLQRILHLGQPEALSAVNQLEDPIRMTEQGLREMRKDLEKSLLGLSELKALAIRSREEVVACRAKAHGYEQKAVELLQAAHKGGLDAATADQLAGEALNLKEENLALAAAAQEKELKCERSVTELEQNLQTLRSTIGKWENELRVLKSRVSVSEATKTMDKQLDLIDSTGTVTLLERLKQNAPAEETSSETTSTTGAEGLGKGLEAAQETARQLAALKAKLGYLANPGSKNAADSNSTPA
ncbi:PspA/IM30 family protein [Sabulibacter ruber]|uniref:PspA/IM30 family protein n=1 Tax=Sabulibacter ruber TaxID=2811901 RepID=UPI001A97C8A1|nr:PspA/IM30 family protein [Sabulibacter ruber]